MVWQEEDGASSGECSSSSSSSSSYSACVCVSSWLQKEAGGQGEESTARTWLVALLDRRLLRLSIAAAPVEEEEAPTMPVGPAARLRKLAPSTDSEEFSFLFLID